MEKAITASLHESACAQSWCPYPLIVNRRAPGRSDRPARYPKLVRVRWVLVEAIMLPWSAMTTGRLQRCGGRRCQPSFWRFWPSLSQSPEWRFCGCLPLGRCVYDSRSGRPNIAADCRAIAPGESAGESKVLSGLADSKTRSANPRTP